MFGSSMIRKFEFYGPQELGVLRNVVLVAHTGPMWVDFVNSKFLLQVLKQVT